VHDVKDIKNSGFIQAMGPLITTYLRKLDYRNFIILNANLKPPNDGRL